MNETLFINYATVLISITFLSLQIGLMYNDQKIIKGFLKKNSIILLPVSIVMILLFFIPLFTPLVSFKLNTSTFYQRMLALYIGCGSVFLVLFGIVFPIVNSNSGANCIKTTDNPSIKKFIKNTRNFHYYIQEDDPEKEECLITEYHLSHLILYMIMGYLIPKRYLFIIFMSIVWEGMELRWDMADVMDFFWNILGVGVGVGSRYLVEHYKNK